MNDEANTHYFGMVDQLLEGHLWMQENLPGKLQVEINMHIMTCNYWSSFNQCHDSNNTVAISCQS